MNSAIPLVGTNFQFNVVSKWEEHRMLCSCFGSTSLPHIDDCRGVCFSQLLWVVKLWR